MTWEVIDAGPRGRRWRCSACGRRTGWTVDPPEKLHHACGKAPPPLLTRAASFAVAAVAHVASGAPRASDELRAARLAVCLACDQFDGSTETCAACGCRCTGRAELLNKLDWADQQCPLKKW